MERRVVLAIFLSALVLIGSQWLLSPPPGAPDARSAGNASGPMFNTDGGAVAPPTGQTPPPPPPTLPNQAPVSVPVVGDSEAREVVLESTFVRAVFANRGARLEHWVLKGYKDVLGQPIDLVPVNAPAGQPRPFSLRLDDAAITASVNDALYRVAEQSGDRVSFELETAEGLRVRKTFTLDPETFVVSFSADVQQGAQTLNPTVEWGPGVTDEIAFTQAGSFLSPSYLYKAQAIYHTGSDVEREAVAAIAPGTVREGAYRWGGVDDHYFISAVLQPPAPVRFEYQPIRAVTPTTPQLAGEYIGYAVRFPAPPQDVRFYVGPKQLDVMRRIDPEFTRAIHFGMFRWFAVPLLDVLRWINDRVGNWGWSIIVLTLLVNFAMFPLRHKSVVSMRRMQEIQPQMKAIQERYAKYKVTDPERQKMNSEVMDLYRAKGVNPASGCVPMLLTLPLLFAFYAMLGQAIEIRGERFWWIGDLATQDPLFITPALMGLSMFWQQKITPTTADPTQQKIMMFMPIMITVTMLFAPAGLVIYWLVSNVWSIGQQYFTNWMIGPPRTPGVGAAKPAKELKAVKPAPADIVVPPARKR